MFEMNENRLAFGTVFNKKNYHNNWCGNVFPLKLHPAQNANVVSSINVMVKTHKNKNVIDEGFFFLKSDAYSVMYAYSANSLIGNW